MYTYRFIGIPLLLVVFSFLNQPWSYAEAVSLQKIEDSSSAPPVKRGKKNKKKRLKKRPRKIQTTAADIVPSLYLTFGLMALLPILVITGLILVGGGFPLLSLLIIGMALIGLGNIAAIIAGKLAGANQLYSTQVLSFALWVLMGINLVGAIVLSILNAILFAHSLLIWGLIAILFCLAIFMLIWALVIRKKNKAFRNMDTEEPSN